jgi:hypothetical protein
MGVDTASAVAVVEKPDFAFVLLVRRGGGDGILLYSRFL